MTAKYGLVLLAFLIPFPALSQVSDSSETRVVFQHEEETESVTYSSDGLLLAAVIRNIPGTPSHWIRIWDTNTMQVIRSYGRHLASDVAFSANDSLIAIAYDRRVAVHDWRSNSDTPIAELRIVPRIWDVAFSNDGKYLLGSNATRAGTVTVWETNTWTEVHKINVGAELPIGSVFGEALTPSPDGRYFAGATDGSTLPIYEIESGDLTCSVDLPVKDNSSQDTKTASIDYSHDGTQIVIVTGDVAIGGHRLDFNYDWIRFIDVATCSVIKEIEFPVEGVYLTRVRFIDDDRLIVGSSTVASFSGTDAISV